LPPIPAGCQHPHQEPGRAGGVKLLSRSSLGVKVTPAGATLLAHARRVLRQIEQLSGDLQEYSSGIKGHVRVFANTTAMSEFLPGCCVRTSSITPT
jgi:DNA-binding transcriptional LysR family regulator